MAGSTFHTNPLDLNKLLDDCQRGILQLPDFQRSWVWDEDRIKSLIASISRAFPIGALMSLDAGGPVNFKPRPVEGAPPEAMQIVPQSLLLDGQQRMTSLYQATLRGKVIETVTPNKKKVKRWFYIDIRNALDVSVEREDAILGVPEDRFVRTDFGREVKLKTIPLAGAPPSTRFTLKIAFSTTPARESIVAGTKSTASRARSKLLTLNSGISQLPSPRNRAMAGWSAGYQAARVRRQLTPGPISSSPGTAGLPPFISFSTSYRELPVCQ
jgi:hypothetical protein